MGDILLLLYVCTHLYMYAACLCLCDVYRILGPVKLSDGPLTEKYCYEMIIEHNSLAERVRYQRLLVRILLNKIMTMKCY
jgi:hypothetical protein